MLDRVQKEDVNVSHEGHGPKHVQITNDSISNATNLNLLSFRRCYGGVPVPSGRADCLVNRAQCLTQVTTKGGRQREP